jgi:hypothetical protein
MSQTGTLEERVERLETRLAKVIETCKNHDFKLCRISEESDGKHNQERKTRIKITGLRNPGDCPAEWNEKKKWIRNQVYLVLRQYDQNIANSIAFAYALGSLYKDTLTLEAQLNGDAANDIKRMHGEKKRNNEEVQCNISNCITKGTGVRIEVLKAITNKFRNEEERWIITMFDPKPVIRVTNNRTRQEKVLTYTDAVRRFGDQLTREDLQDAYEKAGSFFENEMSCTFVVLKDEHMIRRWQERPGPSMASFSATTSTNSQARTFAGAFTEQNRNTNRNLPSKEQTYRANSERKTYEYETQTQASNRIGRGGTGGSHYKNQRQRGYYYGNNRGTNR